MLAAWNRGLQDLNWVQEVVIWLNWAGSITAMVVNFFAIKVTRGNSRKVFEAIFVLSVIYAVGYLTLLFGPFSYTDWSKAMRLTSVPVWPIVWCGPAALKYYKATHAGLITGEVLKVVLEKLESEA